MYQRLVAASGEIHVAIVFAKAHVVPIKVADAGHHESIPRLELQAARLAAEVYAAIVRESGPYQRVVMWTDSECVIKQLRDRHTRFKMYFANRISKIQALTDCLSIFAASLLRRSCSCSCQAVMQLLL